MTDKGFYITIFFLCFYEGLFFKIAKRPYFKKQHHIALLYQIKRSITSQGDEGIVHREKAKIIDNVRFYPKISVYAHNSSLKTGFYKNKSEHGLYHQGKQNIHGTFQNCDTLATQVHFCSKLPPFETNESLVRIEQQSG